MFLPISTFVQRGSWWWGFWNYGPGKARSLGPAQLPTLEKVHSKFTSTAAARERGGGSANKQPHPFTVHQLTRAEMNCPDGKDATLLPSSVAGCSARVDKEGDVP